MAFAIESFGPTPVLDVSLESLSENLKAGATKIKEKVVEFIRRVVEWMKNIVKSKERAVAVGKAQVAKEAEQFKIVLGQSKTLALPHNAFGDASQVWELFGIQDIEAPSRFIYEYGVVFDQAEWAYQGLNQVVVDLVKAFEQDEPNAGYAAVQSYREEVEKRTEELKQLAENQTHKEQNLVQLLKARPSLETIEKAVNALTGFQNDLLNRAQRVNSSDLTDRALRMLGDFVSKNAATAHIRFLEGARDIGNIQARFARVVTERYGWYVEHLFQHLPSARGVRAMAAANRKYGEGAEGDEAFATESLVDFPDFDFALEGFGEKLKEGAVKLKDKVLELIKRFINWLKSIFSKGSAETEKAKAKLQEDIKQAEAAFAATSDEALAKKAFGEYAHVWELLGLENREQSARFVVRFQFFLDCFEEASDNLKGVLGRLKQAIEKKDTSEAKTIVEAYANSNSIRMTKFKQLSDSAAGTDDKLVRLMDAKPSVETLRSLYEYIRDVKEVLLKREDVADKANFSAKMLDELHAFMDKTMDSKNPQFISIVQDLMSSEATYSKTLYSWRFHLGNSMEKNLPLYKIGRIVAAAGKKMKADHSQANERFKEPSTRRQPYWLRGR